MTIRFYTHEDIGPRRALTPEGFLLCKDVALARTGTMFYADGEIPVIQPDGTGLVSIQRDSSDVFCDTAINSFHGKPVTDDHPPEKVDPSNWKQYSVGVVLNPHRGIPPQQEEDLLYADLLIKDEDAIKNVLAGKREVSAGYDAEYEQIKPGVGRQHLIVGNHVALVDKGRCGPRCAIGDKAPMATTKDKKPAWYDNLMRAVATKDDVLAAETLAKVAEMLGDIVSGPDIDAKQHKASASDADKDDDKDKDDKKEETKDEDKEDDKDDDKKDEKFVSDAVTKALTTVLDRLTAVETAIAILSSDTKTVDKDDEDDKDDDKKKDTEDKKTTDEDGSEEKEDTMDKKKSTTDADSSGLRMQFQEVLSRAELLAPGIKLPTFDAKQSIKATKDSLCSFRRKALKDAMSEDETAEVVTSIAGPKPRIADMTCDSISVLFNGASDVIRRERSRANGTGGHVASHNPKTFDNVSDMVKDINKRNSDYWATMAGSKR